MSHNAYSSVEMHLRIFTVFHHIIIELSLVFKHRMTFKDTIIFGIIYQHANDFWNDRYTATYSNTYISSLIWYRWFALIDYIHSNHHSTVCRIFSSLKSFYECPFVTKVVCTNVESSTIEISMQWNWIELFVCLL